MEAREFREERLVVIQGTSRLPLRGAGGIQRVLCVSRIGYKEGAVEDDRAV